jgi:hypothetical protein
MEDPFLVYTPSERDLERDQLGQGERRAVRRAGSRGRRTSQTRQPNAYTSLATVGSSSRSSSGAAQGNVPAVNRERVNPCVLKVA